MSEKVLEPIAYIRSAFPEKFGIPRQSNLLNTEATIVFTEKYRVAEALRGIDGYDYLWLIWEFSENRRDSWSPTVRPPRLGGNTRMGVFATRSTFRPNGLGLSSVKLIRTEKTETLGTVLIVSGADLMDGTPIYDIKPYLAYTDSHPEAASGFADACRDKSLKVTGEALAALEEKDRDELTALLSEDPRPSYQADEERRYAFEYADYHITFRVSGDVLTVEEITRRN